MQRLFSRPPSSFANIRGFAAAHHPNRGNFINRPKGEMSRIARKGGRKGGKAKGVGGFHDMDPEKQHEIASRGGRAVRKAKRESQAEERQRRQQPWGRSVLPSEFDEGWIV